MARNVFFSFHFERDSWRVAQVRNSWVIKPGHIAQPFLDKAQWESIRRKGDRAIRDWIDTQMHGTSVTVVLIGAETAGRSWVQYEIEKSWEKGNGLLGIRIHHIKTPTNTYGDPPGANPFSQFTFDSGKQRLSDHVAVYDWVVDQGRNNIASWIEAAAAARGR